MQPPNETKIFVTGMKPERNPYSSSLFSNENTFSIYHCDSAFRYQNNKRTRTHETSAAKCTWHIDKQVKLHPPKFRSHMQLLLSFSHIFVLSINYLWGSVALRVTLLCIHIIIHTYSLIHRLHTRALLCARCAQ